MFTIVSSYVTIIRYQEPDRTTDVSVKVARYSYDVFTLH